jgi:hypothetical protein
MKLRRQGNQRTQKTLTSTNHTYKKRIAKMGWHSHEIGGTLDLSSRELEELRS